MISQRLFGLCATALSSIFVQGVNAVVPKNQTQPVSTLVDVGYAQYQGATVGNGVNQWLGIRYAAPPLGDLRWRAPQPPLQETEVQDVSTVVIISQKTNQAERILQLITG